MQCELLKRESTDLIMCGNIATHKTLIYSIII